MAEAFGLAVSVATVVDLFVKIGVQCSEYCANVKAAPRDIRDILNEADRFGAALRDIERLLDGPHGAKIDVSQNVCGSIEDCRLQLDTLVTKLEQGTKRARLVWPLKRHEVVDILAKLKRHRAAIASDLQIHQTTVLRTLHQDIILKKLRIVERAGFDAHADTDNATCLAGTRTNILQQISEWYAARESKSIFWLNGMAGTGKSTISRTIAKAFKDRGILGASFFFQRGEGDRGRVTFFFPTIVAQLIRQLPLLAPYVRDEIEADPIIHTKSIKDQFDKLIARPIRELSRESSRWPMVVVVDALDECDNLSDARLVIHLLAQTEHFTSLRLKFFVTSRPELLIQLGFKDIQGQYEGLVLQEIPKPDIHHDITIFMQHELAKIRQDWNNNVRPDRQLSLNWPDGDTQKLIEMAIPLFIFAATACRYLKDRRLGGPQDQLMKVLQHQGGQKSNLDRTYLPVLDPLFIGLAESEKTQVAQRFKKVVGSIVMLATPLSSSALAQLLGISRNTIDDQLDLLHSVLSIPPDPESPIRLLHLSFRDFLIDPEKRNVTPFWIDEKQVHREMVGNCVRVMNAGLRIDICNAQTPGVRRTDIDHQKLADCIPPELEYACLHWVDHLKRGDEQISDGEEVHIFLSNHLLHWMEALSLLGRASDNLGILRILRSLLKPRKSEELLILLDDTIRFSLTYMSTINSYPLQIYSLIAFLPTKSLIRSLFLKIPSAWLSVNGGVEQNWDSCLQILEGHNAEVTSVTFSLDTKHLASASDDRTVRLWDAETGQCLQTLEGHIHHLTSVAFSPDGKRLASASYDRIVRLWDTETGQCLQTFSINMLASFRLSFTPDSSHLQTDAGILTIDDSQGSHPPTELRSEAKYPTISGYGFNEDRCWITWNGCKVLWLPVSFRPVSFAVSESTVITGSVYGKLIIIRISADRLP